MHFGWDNLNRGLAKTFAVLIALFGVVLVAQCQSTLPMVAIHDSELTRALDTTNSPASGATPSGPGTTGLQWWPTNWHYFVMPESLKEAFRSDGTAFTTLGDSNITAGALLLNGQPRYPIVISLACEAIRDDEIAQFTNYVAAGGFLFVGSSSFTRNTNGTTRGDFAIASQMGVSMAVTNLTNWVNNTTLTRAVNHRLTSHIPGTPWVMWNLPSAAEETSWGTYPRPAGDSRRPDLPHSIWRVNTNDATILAYGNIYPYLTIKPYGKGYFIYYAPMQGLMAHGGFGNGMYTYVIFRRAIEWAFESAQIPIPKVSPWPYQYNAAFMVRHDLEVYSDLIANISASAQVEWTNGAKGDYYFCTGTLREDMANSNAAIGGLRLAMTNYGATIGPHNGGFPNPNTNGPPPLTSHLNYNFWHWSTDEALDKSFPGFANGKAYALHSLSNSFINIETWLPGLMTNGMRTWVAPYFNSTREDSYDIQATLGVKISGDQKISPFPHWTLSTRTPNKRYSHLSEPVSDWYAPVSGEVYQEIAQRMEDVPSTTNVHALVDFYYDMGALINFYSHMLSTTNANVSGGGTSILPYDYITYGLNTNLHPRLWSANGIDVYNWWQQRSNVQISTTYTTNSGQTNISMTISGAQNPNTAVEILLPGTNGVTCLSVFTNGVLAGANSYRQIGQTVRVLVGTTVSTVQISYGCGSGFAQDFDGVTIPSLPSGWTTSASGAQAGWYTTNVTFDTDPNSVYCRGASSAGISELVSPALFLPTSLATLSFRNNYITQTNRDGGVLEIKIGTNAYTDIITAGGSWVTGGYNSTLGGSGNSLGGRSGWTGNSGGYITTAVNLPVGVAGQLVQFRWRLSTDNSTSSPGWFIDSVGFQNTPPTLPSQTNRTIVELTTLIVTNVATDPESPPQTLSYQLINPPAGAAITNGVIVWTPTEAQGPSTNIIRTVVSDDGTPSLSATNTFTVVVTEANTAPSLPAQTNRTISELTLLTVTNTATDTDLPANTLIYTLTVTNAAGVVGNASISGQGVIAWTPTEAQGPSVTTFITGVSDGSVSVTNVFTVTVNEVNALPTLPGQNNRTIGQSTMTVTNTATDVDIPANTLTYTLSVTNTGDNSQVTNASINSDGVITWTPTPAQEPSTNLFMTRVSDGVGGSATNTFTVIVNSSPAVSLDSSTLVAEGCFPTNNAVDNGETVTMQFAFKNAGFVNTSNLVVTLLATNGVVLPSDPQSYGVLSTNGTPVTNAFTFTASGACGSNITAMLQMQDGGVNLGLATVSLPLGTIGIILTQNFDSVTAPALPAGWTVQFGGPGMTNWYTTNSLADTAPNAVFCRDPVAVTSNLLISPVVVLPAGSNRLTFRHNYDLEGNASIGYDGGVLEIKIGGGAWQDILAAGGSFISGGYNRTIDPGFQNPLVNRQAWSASSGGYVTTSVALPGAAAGQSVQFRWFFGSDNGTAGNGWRVDSISITGRLCCANSPPILPSPTNRTVPEQALMTVTNTVIDPGVPVGSVNYLLTATNVGNGDPVLNASINANGVITWTPTEAQGPSTNLFTTVALNSVVPGLADTNTFTVVVTEANTPPGLSAQTNRTMAELTSLTVTNTASDADIPANTLSYILLVTNLGSGLQIINASIDTNGVITWTPTEAQGPSTNVFVTIVSDGSATATNSFNVAVTEVNTPPTLPAQIDRTVAELTQLTVTNTASDIDVPANVLSYTLLATNLGTGLQVINAGISANGVITWTPTEAQGPSTNLFVTIVSDGSATATNSFIVTVSEVNSPPTLPGQTNRIVTELTTLIVTNTASDADVPANTLSYILSVTNLGTGLEVTNASIDANGVITWTPTEEQGPSTNSFTTIVSDGTATATNTFNVRVTEVNTPPSLPEQNDRIALELALMTVTNTAIDVDLPANVLTYALVVTNLGTGLHITNAFIDANGVITWTPTAAQGPSTNVFVTIVSDGNASATNSFNVTVTEVNTPPTLPAQTNQIIAELTLLTVTNTASDGDVPANPLVYSLSATNLGTGLHINNASIDTNGVITWTPTEAQGPSTNIFVTIVSDGIATATNSFDVTVLEINSPPGLPPQTNLTIPELILLTVTNTATDSDLPADTLIYTLAVTNLSTGLAVTNANIDADGVITWTPTEAQGPSTNVFTTTVSDGKVTTANVFEVIVTEVNTAPTLPAQTNHTIPALCPIVVTNTATDTDIPANTLLYSLIIAPTNAAISAEGIISWTPNAGQSASTNIFTTVVSDGTDSATNSFDVIVGSNPGITSPVIQSISYHEGEVVVVWSSVEGRAYRLQYKDIATETNWIDLTPDVLGTGANVGTTNAVNGAVERFYRVFVVPTP